LKLDPGGPIPTAITVPADQPFALAGDVVEPLPKSVFEPNFNQVLDYHVDKVTFTVPLKAAAAAPAGKQTVRVAASYQTCNDRLCLPARQVISSTDVQIVPKTR
jgi:DsbC/DsbD-like thiol-disulfide interchange protein